MVEIFISPIGEVEKSQSSTAIRLINAYSYPDGVSVNEFTEHINFPEVSCNPPHDIACRVFELRTRFPGHPILVMLGDVSGAFRHIPLDAHHVHMFAFRFEGYIVKLLGSLRYISTCFPSAWGFYQNVHAFATTFPHNFTRRQGVQDVYDDLGYLLAVLSQEKQLKRNSRRTLHPLYVLEPQLKEYIRVRFSTAVRETFARTTADNSINLRELMSVALAALRWGPAWAPTGRDRTHIQMWIDNTSAVAWLENVPVISH
ncbi:hypothetical protein PHMEG_0004634 [Phytophthora megakarya]|uniref:Uncharacterized protein n=1 Tax=Phytophthora megakarya TaxID=4795 RepID=A0A225WTC6_9STRA|nr:hypothetical protein PHMEG_0004634 [Phytophthora megakarya]